MRKILAYKQQSPTPGLHVTRLFRTEQEGAEATMALKPYSGNMRLNNLEVQFI
jgi:hypothetical protein